jgi:hypothetical protein
LIDATRNGATWTTEVVEATGSTGHFPSLALGAAGRAHIVYFKKGPTGVVSNELHSAHQLPAGQTDFSCGNGRSGWHCEIIPSVAPDPQFDPTGPPHPTGLSSIAIDKNSVLHVAFAAARSVVYTRKVIDSMGWEKAEEVDLSLPNGAYPYGPYDFEPTALVLKLDSQAKPHLLLREHNGRLLWPREQVLAYWPAEIVATASSLDQPEYQSMALGSDDQPRIVFNQTYPASGVTLTLAQRAAFGTWNQVTVENPGGLPCSLTLEEHP